MKKFISLVAGLLLGAGMLFAQDNYSDLIISEYVEGSGNNKALEIYNGTGAAVDLSAYSLMKQTNGEGEYKNEVKLEGTLADGATYVIVNKGTSSSATDPELLGLADLTEDKITGFNGNDAVALFKNGTKIDEVGVFNQVADWGKDVTLRRKCGMGPTATYDAAEWDSYQKDDWSDLGMHCGEAAPDEDAPEVDMVITSISNPRLITVQFNENIQQVWEAFVMDMTEEDEDYDIDSLRVRGKQLLIYVNRDMVAGHEYLVSADEILDIAGNDTWLEEFFYFGYQDVKDVAEIMAMREDVEAGTVGAQKFRITGDVVITAMFGKNIYIQDKDCATVKGHSICLYDAKGDAISGEVQVGTVVNGVIGELTIYNGLFEMNYIEPGCVTGTEVVEPVAGVSSIYDVLGSAEYQSALVKFENVEFSETGTFEVRKTYNVEDEDNTIAFYTQTDENADFIGMAIPQGKGTVVGYITVYKDNNQICPRTKADIFGGGSTPSALEARSAVKFNVYPNPTRGEVNLDVKGQFSVGVYNLAGMEVMRTQQYNGKAQLNLSGLAKGVYMLEIRTERGNGYSKVVVR